MWLLEKLTKELFQNSIEYAVNIDFSNSLIFVICLIAILIWILSAVYHTIKGVYNGIIEAKWNYKYHNELKKFDNYQLTKHGLTFGIVNSNYKCEFDKPLYFEKDWNLLKRELLLNIR